MMYTYDVLKDALISEVKGAKELFEHLENDLAFKSQPASSKFHLACEGGLLTHSVSVANLAIANVLMWEDYTGKKIEENVILCSLLHDVGKCGEIGKSLYFKSGNGYAYNKELIGYPHSYRSVDIITKFVKLTDGEIEAVKRHDGQYSIENKVLSGHERPFTLLLHHSDLLSSRFLEDDKKS